MSAGRRIREHREEILRVAALHGAGNVLLPGSVARREDTSESDVDLLVDVTGIPRAALASALRVLLYGVAPLDPAVMAGVAASLLTVAFIANYVPARRATRIDPMEALHQELPAERRGRVSLAPLYPTLAGGPMNRLASTPVDERLGIFLRQAARPSFESLLGEIGAFGVGILQ